MIESLISFKLILNVILDLIGYKPYKITHASDNFEKLYEFAVVLIKKGLAYVCHQTADDMKGFDTEASPWRDRSIDLNLQLFEVSLKIYLQLKSQA